MNEKTNDHNRPELIQDRAIKVDFMVIDGRSYTVIGFAPVSSKEHPIETVIDKLRCLVSES